MILIILFLAIFIAAYLVRQSAIRRGRRRLENLTPEQRAIYLSVRKA